MRHTCLFAGLLFGFLYAPLLQAQKIDTIRMVWTDNHSALLLPVDIDGHPPTRYMQFDLGAAGTLFYKNALPGFTDTLRNFSFRVGGMRFSLPAIPVKAAGAPGRIIGTLGADFIDGRVVIFDYPHHRLLLADSLPASYSVRWQPFYFPGRRVLLPATIGGKQTILYFDTGSSAYSLLTDSVTWARMAAKDAIATHTPVNSWGRTLVAHTVATGDSIGMAGLMLPLRQVSYISGASVAQEEQMKKMGMGGLIGNLLFMERVLVLDTRKQRFVLQ